MYVTVSAPSGKQFILCDQLHDETGDARPRWTPYFAGNDSRINGCSGSSPEITTGTSPGFGFGYHNGDGINLARRFPVAGSDRFEGTSTKRSRSQSPAGSSGIQVGFKGRFTAFG